MKLEGEVQGSGATGNPPLAPSPKVTVATIGGTHQPWYLTWYLVSLYQFQDERKVTYMT